MDELVFASTVELARRIREKELSAVQVVTAHLERIAQVNPKLNAVVAFAEDAIAQAEAADATLAAGEPVGPLHGVPMTIKDSLNTAGVISTWGTPGRKDFVPNEDATVVARLRQAGAILLGKSNTPEFTLSFETTNNIYGRTHNPYDLSRSPGGSSGGAAAIVAAGGAPFDIGTDTGGSIRLPAHFCGIAGIRPTSGRVPRTGHAVPYGTLTDQLTTVGPLARFVGDLEPILRVIAGPDGRDPAIAPVSLGDPARVSLKGMRVGYFTDNGIVSPTAETVAAVERAAGGLVAGGARVEEVSLPGIDQTHAILRGMMNALGRAWERMALARAGTSLDETAMTFAKNTPALDAEGIMQMQDRWDRFRVAMLQFFQPYDLLLCPVNAGPAIVSGTLDQHYLNYTYTMTFNLTGWPAAVVRTSTSQEGLPIGVQTVAHPWREDVALAAAAFLEEKFGGWQRPGI